MAGSDRRRGRRSARNPSWTPRAAARLMSIPTRSISSNGPIGNPAARMAWSIPSIVASPLARISRASRVNGRLTRLTMKPGVSRHRTGTFPQAPMSATIRSTTACPVDRATTTSTRGMTGAGLKKCNPMTRSGRDVASAIAPTDRALVLVARMASARAPASSERKIVRLASRSSSAASMTRPGPAAARKSSVWAVSSRARRPSIQASADFGVEVQAPGASFETGSDARPSSLDRGGVDVMQHHRVAGLERQLGDPGAHRAGSDHADDDRARRRRGHHQTGLIASNGCRQSRQ